MIDSVGNQQSGRLKMKKGKSHVAGRAKARIRSLWIVTAPRAVLLATSDIPSTFAVAYSTLPIRDKAPGTRLDIMEGCKRAEFALLKVRMPLLSACHCHPLISLRLHDGHLSPSASQKTFP